MANSVDSMAQRISSKVHSLGSVFTNSANNMSGSYKTAFGAIGDAMARLEARIQSTAGNLTSALGQKVLNPINSSWSSMFTNLTSKANSFADRVQNSFGGRILSSVNNLASNVSGKARKRVPYDRSESCQRVNWDCKSHEPSGERVN